MAFCGCPKRVSQDFPIQSLSFGKLWNWITVYHIYHLRLGCQGVERKRGCRDKPSASLVLGHPACSHAGVPRGETLAAEFHKLEENMGRVRHDSSVCSYRSISGAIWECLRLAGAADLRRADGEPILLMFRSRRIGTNC